MNKDSPTLFLPKYQEIVEELYEQYDADTDTDTNSVLSRGAPRLEQLHITALQGAFGRPYEN